MSPLAALLRAGTPAPAHRPWPRAIIGVGIWQRLILHLACGEFDLLGLWGEPDCVHMALRAPETGDIAVFTLPCPQRRFPSVGLSHPPAIRLERSIQDLFGLEPEGAEDTRHWLDHGAWPHAAPMAAPMDPPMDPRPPPHAYRFLPVIGDNLHEIPVGPVHAGIIEPGHFRFTADGETIVRLEQRLGYTHKGTEALMQGATLAHAARLAGRVSGDATVAYAASFARAAEAALGIEPPPRAIHLRALMGEIERLANHIGDFGAICNDAAFAIMQAHTAMLRERLLRATDACFGHRLMMDRIIPGGVAASINPAGVAASINPAGVAASINPTGIAALRALLPDFAARLDSLVDLYDSTASLLQRTVGTGIVKPEYAARFAAGGPIGRASGRSFDCRIAPGYAPYDRLAFTIPTLAAGDVNARIWIRIHEMRASLGLIAQLLDTLPPGPCAVAVPAASGEGMALSESFRGDVLVWLRIEAGHIARCHLRDPSWFQWPLLETCVDGNIVADFPLCNKSFNCSYSGSDL